MKLTPATFTDIVLDQSDSSAVKLLKIKEILMLKIISEGHVNA